MIFASINIISVNYVLIIVIMLIVSFISNRGDELLVPLIGQYESNRAVKNVINQRETSVASSPVIFAHHKQDAPIIKQSIWPNYNQQNYINAQLSSKINGELFNQPPVSQDDAKRLEQYLINYPRYFDNNNGEQLNLAHINNRALSSIPFKPPATSPKIQTPETGQGKYALFGVPQSTTTQLQRSDQKDLQDKQTTIDQTTNKLSRQDIDLTRKGRVDDVVVFNKNSNKYIPSGTSMFKKLVQDHLGRAPLPPGCIGRAASYTSKCEDHLIKRLSQDATEGRTVLDVSRRVCCALFWHKDCISRVVVELCPDSNPVAADLLIGSRNLDLTMSCQKFNRDGCNAAPHGLSLPSMVQLLMMASILILVITRSFTTDLHLLHSTIGHPID